MGKKVLFRTKEDAKVPCLIKWDHARKTGCTDEGMDRWLYKHHPDIYHLTGECGYCAKYYNLKNALIGCNKCPLFKLWGIKCGSVDSKYAEWTIADSKKDRKRIADEIYKDIEKS